MKRAHLRARDVGRISLGGDGDVVQLHRDDEAVRTIDRALDLGVTLIDTTEQLQRLDELPRTSGGQHNEGQMAMIDR
jgi:diketogulonate reductase-like aldo/keto reductase